MIMHVEVGRKKPSTHYYSLKNIVPANLLSLMVGPWYKLYVYHTYIYMCDKNTEWCVEWMNVIITIIRSIVADIYAMYSYLSLMY